MFVTTYRGLLFIDYVQRSSSSLYRILRYRNCLNYITLVFVSSTRLFFFSLFLSYSGWHTLPSHASAQACLTGWPNEQPQGRDQCSVARHRLANLMVCVVCSCCATSPYREV